MNSPNTNIHVTGRHVSVTEAIRNYAENVNSLNWFCGFVEEAFSETGVVQEVLGRKIKGFPPSPDHPVWLRDHTYQMRGFRHFEPDVKSTIEGFARNQQPDGATFDYFDKDGRGKRVAVEADVEYLLVEGVYLAWQSTGDDKWMAGLLPYLEKGLAYAMSDKMRWSPQHQLVKRAFTVDTWDFVYNPDGRYKSHPYGELDEHTTFCIMHGDNSGMYQAAKRLAKLYRHLGDYPRADHWEEVAEGFRERTNRLCWNGRFYTHQVHLDPVTVKGVDEARQLSLSNAFNLNRGIADFGQCCSIIEEYLRRRVEAADSFAEWFGIHPPFPENSFHAKDYTGEWVINPGWYINGGVLPLVGGELARGAFENGFESYGVDILDRYWRLVRTTGPYVWYHLDGRPCGTFKPPDVWGLSAMLVAMIEGLVGVRDTHRLYEEVAFSPRLCVAGIPQGSFRVEYAASGAYFDYAYALDAGAGKMSLKWKGKNTREVACHVLLPAGKKAVRVRRGGDLLRFRNAAVRQSSYVDFRAGGDEAVVIEFT